MNEFVMVLARSAHVMVVALHAACCDHVLSLCCARAKQVQKLVVHVFVEVGLELWIMVCVRVQWVCTLYAYSVFMVAFDL